MIHTSSNEFKDELIEFKEENELMKKLEEEMGKELEEALRRNVPKILFRNKYIRLLFPLGLLLSLVWLQSTMSYSGFPLP